MTKELAKPKNAIQMMAEKFKVDPESLKIALKATVCRGQKQQDGTYRPMTDPEFISFIIVANAYGLNPITKEIYAFVSERGGGVVPVVSTDGWTKMLTSHQEYAGHFYTESDETVTMANAKECPKWMEIHIKRKDGAEIVTREYLDEVFRDLTYSNPWMTHTKRMLRHKTKIQGAREAFGLCGIYDQDEAERIIENQEQVGLITDKTVKPAVQIPQKLAEEPKAEIPEKEEIPFGDDGASTPPKETAGKPKGKNASK